jgi:hypothetical protein
MGRTANLTDWPGGRRHCKMQRAKCMALQNAPCKMQWLALQNATCKMHGVAKCTVQNAMVGIAKCNVQNGASCVVRRALCVACVARCARRVRACACVCATTHDTRHNTRTTRARRVCVVVRVVLFYIQQRACACRVVRVVSCCASCVVSRVVSRVSCACRVRVVCACVLRTKKRAHVVQRARVVRRD